MPIGYYTTARRLHHWKRLLGPFATWTEAHRARERCVLPPEADTFDVERVQVPRGRVLPVVGDM